MNVFTSYRRLLAARYSSLQSACATTGGVRGPANMYIEHLRIPVGAGAQHVERVGRGGRPIVLLHGFGTCAFLWRAVAPGLAHAGFTALSVDLVGYGESDKPTDAAYGLAAQVEYLDHALTALRLPKAIIVGQDVGALVALQLAVRRPERVERLVLVNPSDPADLPGAPVRALQRASARVAMGANSLFGAAPLLTPLLRESVADPANMSELLMARYLAPYLGSEGVSHLLLLARSLEVEDDDGLNLGRVQAPVLLVHGVSDPAIDATLVARLLAELSATAAIRLETMHGVGRLVAEDAPAELAALIRDWANVLT